MCLYCFRSTYTSSGSCLWFRCVLAASSPVLASIVSSTGALVELQVPCVSDSVLAHVLDYIYTGALPCTQSHQQYSNLFTAACYLKMDDLRRRLETQAKQLQLSGSDNRASLESTWEDTPRGAATSSCSLSGQTLQGINTGSCGQITIVPSLKLPKAIPVPVEMCRVSRRATEVQQYQVLSACPANPESWLQSTDVQTGAAENKRSSAKEGEMKRTEATQQLCLVATSVPEEAQTLRGDEQIRYAPGCGDNVTSPSSPRPSCGAVPVIRHSSTAAVAEARKVPNYHPPFEDISTQPSSHNGTQRFDCCSRSDDHIGHSPKSAEEQPHPVEEPDTGSVFKYEGVSNTEERKEQHTYLSRCVSDTDELSSRPSRHTTEKNTEGPDFVQHEGDGENSQLCATSTVQMDNTCDPSESVVEQSYHAHLHYHWLHPEDTLLSHRTSDPKHAHPGLSGKASDEEEEGLFSSAAQNFTPADQVLLLDISTKPPELLISYSYGKQGDWGLLGQDTSEDQREGEAAGSVADDGKDGLEDKKVDVESNDKTSETLGHQVKDPDADEESYTLKFMPSCMPDSLQAPTSPTSSFCIPSTISANMPTVISPQLSNHHPFQCSMCHRSFSQRGSLNRHMRSHLGIRPFPCPRCPMTFSRQYRVSEHMRVHQRCVLGNDFQKPRASSTWVNESKVTVTLLGFLGLCRIGFPVRICSKRLPSWVAVCSDQHSSSVHFLFWFFLVFLWASVVIVLKLHSLRLTLATVSSEPVECSTVKMF